MVVKKTGTKEEVWHGVAQHTKGGLTKGHLTVNKKGQVVSAAKHAQGVKNVHKTLGAYSKPKHGSTRGRAMLGGAMLGGYLL